MSKRSVDNLFDIIEKDDITLMDSCTVVDYAFIHHFEKGNPCFTKVQFNLLGLYKGCYLLGATRDDFHNAAIANKLEDFIIKTYNGRTSGYYQMFLAGMFNLKNGYPVAQ